MKMKSIKRQSTIKINIVFALVAGIMMISGIGATQAWFSTEAEGNPIVSAMGTVDIELTYEDFVQSKSFNAGTAYFTVDNMGTSDVYLRAGLVFELEQDGKAVIADASGIEIVGISEGWSFKAGTLPDGFTKWFLTYTGGGESYAPFASGESMKVIVEIAGVPDGYDLKVNTIPEAVQVDEEGKALADFIENAGW